MISFLWDPFVDFSFMRYALATSLSLSCACGPLGVFLHLQRLSLAGEALSHGLLPGLAIAYALSGFWMPGLLIGGLTTGLCLVMLSYGVEKRRPHSSTDVALSAFYLIALAFGIVLLSLPGQASHNLFHFLFGNILAVSPTTFWGMLGLNSCTGLFIWFLYKGLVAHAFDPLFAHCMKVKPSVYRIGFLSCVVVNLVVACQAMGTLMALSLMVIPGAAARLLGYRLPKTLTLSMFLGCIASYAGLLISYYGNLPSGPTITLCAGVLYGICCLPLKQWWGHSKKT